RRVDAGPSAVSAGDAPQFNLVAFRSSCVQTTAEAALEEDRPLRQLRLRPPRHARPLPRVRHGRLAMRAAARAVGRLRASRDGCSGVWGWPQSARNSTLDSAAWRP